MQLKLRVILLILFTLVFFVLFCIVWLDNVLIQALTLLAVLLSTALRFSIYGLWKKIISISPILVFLCLIYALLGIWGFGKPPSYWFHYGITRTLILTSSLLYMQIAISWLNPEDFLDSTLSIQSLKYLILGKHLYNKSISAYRDLCVFSTYMPSNQVRNKTWKELFINRLAVVLALIAYVLNEATLKGEMIDERIRLCHPEAGTELKKKQSCKRS